MNRVMKDSGIEWIGNIPQEWEIIKNKYVFKRRNNKVAENYINYQLLSLTKKGIVEKNLNETGGKLPASFSTYQEVQKDDIVLCLFDLDVSAVFSGISKYHGMISSAYDIFKTNQDSIPDYYDYLFQIIGFDRLYLPFSKSLRKTINKENFNSIYTIKPPYNEQIKIVDFLNKSTMNINNIITQTHQSIEELKKYKQSLIAESVTKGIDPNVEMKDSGIEWIDNIPKHWEIRSIGNHYFQVKDKNLLSQEENLLSLSYGKIVKRNYHSADGLLPANFDNYIIVEPNDIVLRMTDLQNDHKSLRTGFVNESGIITSAYIILRPQKNQEFISKFIQLFLHSFDIYKGFYGMGSGVRQNVTFNDIKKLKIILPPIIEQKQILRYLENKVSTIDKLIENKIKIIEELENYKKSLIYEYVTGKKEV
ncbi:restriction endonuclease subunit S [Staphylococcus epidermidis]|uniref:restriction endonuclease subunit S n=1 Tax=Staphylococcus epidermidis TaxID=1282 RepID=UPI001E539162|nr:restriction endonuclease subunit S [Staphylococcus epidermidis]